MSEHKKKHHETDKPNHPHEPDRHPEKDKPAGPKPVPLDDPIGGDPNDPDSDGDNDAADGGDTPGQRPGNP